MKALIMVMTSYWRNLELYYFHRALQNYTSLVNLSSPVVSYAILEGVEETDKQPTPKYSQMHFQLPQVICAPRAFFGIIYDGIKENALKPYQTILLLSQSQPNE